MRTLLPIISILIVSLTSVASAQDDEKNFLEAGGPRWRRLKSAENLLKAGKVDVVFKGSKSIGQRAADDDLDLLVALTLDEHNPLVRFVYAYGLAQAAPEKVVPLFRDKLAKGDAGQQTRGLEALGLLRDPATIDIFLEYGAKPDRMVATEAFRALARLMARKDAKERLVPVTIATPNETAAIRGAWALADIMKSPKGAAGSYGRLARGKTPEADRAKALISDLTDEGLDKPVRYAKTHLEGLEKWFKRSKPVIRFDGDPLGVENLKKTLKYMQEKTPSYHQLVLRGLDTIAAKTGDSPITWATRTMNIQATVASDWKEPQLSTILVRGATQILLRDLGDVHWERRGFEQAGKNVFWYVNHHSGYKLDDVLGNPIPIGKYIDDSMKRKPWR